MDAPDAWTSAADLAEYAYCPRAHWYRAHPPDGGPTSAARRQAEAGTRYHERTLGAERRRAEAGGAYWVALGFGILIALGALAWLFHP